jgi:hypothetical protein
MSSIHSLSGIIEQLELRVSNFKVDNPTPKQLSSIENQVKLIQQLTSIYEEYNRFTLWDLFVDIQNEHDRMIASDKELEGLIIKIPFKHEAVNYGYINFIL